MSIKALQSDPRPTAGLAFLLYLLIATTLIAVVLGAGGSMS